MAVYVLWMVAAYLRPSEPLSIRRGDIQPPLSGVSSRWQLLLFPESRPDRSKTYAANDSIELHCVWCPLLALTAAAMHSGPANQLVFPFSYPAFLKEWHIALKMTGLIGILVPYCARHSGPSIDAAKSVRTKLEIQTRGRWASVKSVERYERRARLTQSWNKLTASQQAHAKFAESHLEGMLRGSVSPDVSSAPLTRD